MRLQILSCEVLARELYYCAATSPHIIDIHFLRRGLHDTPDVLRERIQQQVDLLSAPAGDDALPPDAVCLGYGLCGNSLVGVEARRVQLILPRAHDCITLYMGSRSLYQKEFTSHPGTYYYAMDYIERQGTGSSVIPLGTTSDARRKEVYDEYVQKYGKDNADYLLEVMGGWTAHYNRAAYIDMGIADGSSVEQYAQEQARSKGWAFEKLAGNLSIIRKLAMGQWDSDFLIVPPGASIKESYDAGVVTCGAGQPPAGA
jgi:hypothetical protein